MLRITILFFIFSQIINSQSAYDLEVYDPEREYTQSFIDSLTSTYASGENKGSVSVNVLKEVLDKNPNIDAWIRYYAGMSSITYREKKIDSALFYANKGISYFHNKLKKTKLDSHVVLHCHLLKGTILNEDLEHHNSLKELYKALEIANKYGYKYRGYILGNIANNHLDLDNHNLALEYQLKIIKDTIYMSYPRAAIAQYNQIGVSYSYQNESEKAIEYFKKGIQKALFSNEKVTVPALFGNIGKEFEKLNKIDSTKFYFEKSVNFTKTNNLKDLYLAFDDNQMYYESYLQYYQGDYRDAEKKLNQLIENIKNYPVLNKDGLGLLKDAYLRLGMVYERLDDASHYSKLIEDSFENIKSSNDTLLKINLSKLEQQFKSKQKDATISQLELERESQNLILKQRTTLNWVLFGLSLVILLLIYSLFKRYQQKHKYNSVILEQRLLRSQLNPHFLFNSLNTINSLMILNPEKVNSYVSKLGMLFRSILENSREELVPLEEELEILDTYLDLQSNFSEKFTYQLSIDMTAKGDILIPPMLIQPFVENTIIHGFSGLAGEHISISVSKDSKNSCLHCQIKDNGIGYSNSKKRQQNNSTNESLSGSILKERLAIYAKTFKSNAYFQIKDIKETNGTLVDLYLPYIIDS